MPGSKFEVQCYMASHMEWHQPVQEEADWLRLLLLKNEVRNIADTTPVNPALISCIEWRLYKKKHDQVWAVAVRKRIQ